MSTLRRFLVLSLTSCLTGPALGQEAGVAPADTSGTPREGADEEIVVIGRPAEQEISKRRLSIDEVEQIPGFGGDAIKSIQALPGVARPSFADPGAIVVRGSGRLDTRYFLDGIDIPLLFHFGGVKSTYNSLALESLDLYPGGYGTRFGGVVGGVVEVQGRSGRRDRWRRVIDASFLDASFHAEGPLGRDWSLLLTGRRSFAGEIADAIISQSDDLDFAVAPYYWDGVARVDRHGARSHFFATAFITSDVLRLVVPDAQEGSAEVNAAIDEVETDLRYARLIAGWDRDLSRSLSNSLRASLGWNRERFHAFGFFDFVGDGTVYQLRDELSWDAAEAVTAKAGVDLVYAPVDYAVRVAGSESSIQAEDYSDLGFYTNLELRPTDRLEVVPGIRYDYYTHLDEGDPSLRFGARYALNDAHTLTGSIGTYNQPPQPIGHSTDPVFGNPELPPTRARHFTLGDEWRINRRLSLEVQGYYNTHDQIPVITDSLDLNFLPDAEGRMYGIELMLRHAPDNGFFGWVSYSLSRSERRFQRRPGEESGFEQVDGQSGWDPDTWVPHTYDQTHHLEALASYRIGAGWSTGARLQAVSGNPMTPFLGFTSDQYEFDSDEGDYVPLGGEYLSERFDPHVRVDIRVDKRFAAWNADWSVYFDLQNAGFFLYDSPEGYSYNYDFSKRDAFGWVPIPALGLRVEF